MRASLRWYQYTLRTLLLATFVCTILLSCFTAIRQQARRQHDAAAVFYEMGLEVVYDYQSSLFTPPEWLRELLGDDFFYNVVEVDFDLRNNDVTDHDERKALVYLEALPHLRTLYAKDRDDAFLECLARLKIHLADLHLAFGGDRVTSRGLQHLRAMPTESLHVMCGVTDEDMKFFDGLVTLKALEICDIVTEKGLEYLKDLPHLESLDLGPSDVTNAGLEYLKGLRSLRSLRFYRGEVTDEAVNELRQALPNCRVDILP